VLIVDPLQVKQWKLRCALGQMMREKAELKLFSNRKNLSLPF
jgi:hypothetical protein